METKLFTSASDEAAELIKKGGLVAVPTETVYGLAADGTNAQAVEQIYEVKGRPTVKPLSLMVHGPEAIGEFCRDVPQAAYELARRFWPGPLTIVLKAREHIPSIVLAGGSTVGLRCPDHPVTLELLKKTGKPFAAPSANPSGEASPKTARQVIDYFDGKIEGVIDGGACGLGAESTIIDMSSKPYRILRQGVLPREDIESALEERLCVIGITGGTGSGKTTALNTLKELGAEVLDCDRVYHEMLETDAQLLEAIEQRFPGTVSYGALDRKELGSRVFSDPAALADLNSITHKFIDMEIERRLRAYAMAGGELAAIDAIELFAGGQAKRCKKTLAVLADREIRLERIMSRDGIDRDYAQKRIDAQRPDSYFIENCDYTLYNNGSQEGFAARCRNLFKEIIDNG